MTRSKTPPTTFAHAAGLRVFALTYRWERLPHTQYTLKSTHRKTKEHTHSIEDPHLSVLGGDEEGSETRAWALLQVG